jgi:hypothetical protein
VEGSPDCSPETSPSADGVYVGGAANASDRPSSSTGGKGYCPETIFGSLNFELSLFELQELNSG